MSFFIPHSETRGEAMRLTAAASVFVVVLLSVSVIQGQDGWGVTYTSAEICALKGSTVEMSCTLTYPPRINGRVTTVQESFWFAELNGNQPVDLRTDSKYSERVQYYCKGNMCSLRIKDLRRSDSAEYKFRFITNQPDGSYIGQPGVTLSVTDLLVKMESSKFSSWAGLTCHSHCNLPDHSSYSWFRNGEIIRARTSSSYSAYFNRADSYSCALAGYERFHSLSVCVQGQTCNKVTYSERSICATKGSSVDISCTYNHHGAANIRSKFWFSPDRSHRWQHSAHPEDIRKDFQDAGRVQVLDSYRKRSTLRIRDLTESDSAEYRFKFTTGSFEWRSSLPGTTLTVTALQVQVNRLTVRRSHTEAELKCHSSCTSADRLSYVWFNNGQEVTWMKTSTYKRVFNPGDIISCALKGHEAHRSPSVYAPKLPSVSVSPAEIMEDSSVTLNCSSDANPAANYTWYKNNGDPDLHPLSKEPQLVFSSIRSSDSGEYYCAAENELGRKTSEHFIINVKYAPKLPSVSVSPPGGEIVEGSSVTLTCSSDANPAANYTWYKENGDPDLHPLSNEPQLVFSSFRSSDSGEYYCAAENELGRKTSGYNSINVKHAPKLPSVSVSPPAGEIVEGSSVTLTCSSDANPAANYTWYKENEDAAKASGQNFTITDFRHEHSGNYYCEAQNTRGRRNSTLHVIAVAGNSNVLMNSIRLTLVVLMLIPLLLLSLWTRRRKTLSFTTEPPEPADTAEYESPEYENISDLTGAQTEDTERQEDML